MRRKWHKSHAFCSNFPHPREPNTRLNDNLFGEGWEMSATKAGTFLGTFSFDSLGHLWSAQKVIPLKTDHK